MKTLLFEKIREQLLEKIKSFEELCDKTIYEKPKIKEQYQELINGIKVLSDK